MYYTVIKHSGHLKTLEKCRKHSPAARVFYISLVFSNVRRAWSPASKRFMLGLVVLRGVAWYFAILYLASRIFFISHFLSRISYVAFFISHFFYLASRIFNSHLAFFLSRISHFYLTSRIFLSRISHFYVAFTSRIFSFS